MVGFKVSLLSGITLFSFIRSKLVCYKEIITPEFYVVQIFINTICHRSKVCS